MRRPALGHVLVVLAVLLLAGNAVVGRLASEADVPALGLNFWRWAIAFSILLPFALHKLRRQHMLLRAHWRLIVLFGLITIAGFNSALYVGLQHTTVVQGTLILAALPILVLAWASIVLREQVIPRQVSGAVVSILGVGLIVARGDPGVLGRLTLNIGDIWVLLAVALWAGQTIIIRMVPKSIDLIAFQVASIAVGLVVLAPFHLLETFGGKPMPMTSGALVLIAYAGVMASVIGFTLWNLGVAQIGPQSASYFGNLFPVFGAMLGVLLLGEVFAWYHALGGALALGGIYLGSGRHGHHLNPIECRSHRAQMVVRAGKQT